MTEAEEGSVQRYRFTMDWLTVGLREEAEYVMTFPAQGAKSPEDETTAEIAGGRL
jgi:hypothetical protein